MEHRIVKTLMLHNTKPKHWCIYNSATNQTINYQLYIYMTQMGGWW